MFREKCQLQFAIFASPMHIWLGMCKFTECREYEVRRVREGGREINEKYQVKIN